MGSLFGRPTLAGLLFGLLVLSPSVGCDDAAPSDGDADADADSDGDVERCLGDEDCDDGVFCDGAERCDPGAEGADGRGCLDVAAPACPEDQLCDEAGDRCLSGCELDPDRDGDGHESLSCGGDDCDDSDPNRFPGNPEDCDTLGHDEDCDLSTLGPDADGDGFVFDQCCNLRDDGSLRCGDDCDDGRGGVNPGATEACNGLDDDCDGELDEGTLLTFYRDIDGDGYGVTSEVLEDCSAPLGYVINSGDCDDSLPAIHPGALELCDGAIDENCDGAVDEGCPCTVDDPPRPCGEDDPEVPGGILTEGACQAGTQRCSVLGEWGACEGFVGPIDELCNGVDDDCDGELDDGPSMTCVQGQVDEGCDTPCGNPGRRECGASCRWVDEVCRADVDIFCDYCGDTAAGVDSLIGEVPIATIEDDVTFLDSCCSSGRRLIHGEATCPSEIAPWGLVNGDGADEGGLAGDERGAAYFDGSFLLGYGELTIEASMDVSAVPVDASAEPCASHCLAPNSDLCRPGDGWAIVILRVDGLTNRLGAGLDLGVPQDRNGYSIEWWFFTQAGMLWSDFDSLRLNRLDALAGATPVDSNGDVDDSLDCRHPEQTQRLQITLRGDIPGTDSNEMAIIVEQVSELSGTIERMRCSGNDCQLRLVAGVDEVQVGYTAASAGGRRGIVNFDTLESGNAFSRQGLCD